MTERPENVTVVILSEEEAKEISVRHSLRCIRRDIGYLVRAFGRHYKRFYRIYSRGFIHKNHWWMQIKR